MQHPLLFTKRPYLLTLSIVAMITSVNLALFGGTLVLRDVPPVQMEFLAEMAMTLMVIGLLVLLNGWGRVGFRALRSVKDLRLYWIPVVPLIPVLGAVVAGMSRMHPRDIALLLALACLIGFVEEVSFRGLILQALASRGVWRAAVISSILFGLMHLQNLLFGADLVATVLQIAYATAMGFGFASVTLRTGSIWPLVAIHALIDFAGFVTSGGTVIDSLTGTDVAVYALYIVAFTGYGVFNMRAMKRSRENIADMAPAVSS
jgi:uncharacterized protein